MEARGKWKKDKPENNKLKEVEGNKTREKMNRKAFAVEFALMALMSLLSCGLPAPAQSQTTSSTQVQRNKETAMAIELPTSTCPGYQTGNPSRRDLTGCETGTSLDPIDHMTAFGFSNGENPDWSSCGIPELPEAK